MSDQNNLFKSLTESALQILTDSFSSADRATAEPNPFVNGPIVIVSRKADAEWTVEYTSSNIRLFGFSAQADAWPSRNFLNYIHKDDRSRVENEIRDLVQTGKTTGRLQYRIAPPDRTNRWAEDFLIIQRDHQGLPSRYFSFLQDITYRRQAEERFRILYEIAHDVNSTATLEELLYKIHQCIRTVMLADNFYVAIYDEKTDLVSFPYFVDQYDRQPAPRAKRHGLTEHVIHTGSPFLVTPKSDPALLERHGIVVIGTMPECWLGIPLKLQNKTIGALVLQSYDTAHRYHQSDIDLLSALANEIAFAVERKRASEDYFRQSEWLKVTLASIGDAVIACDKQGRVIFMNRVASMITGWQPAEAEGKDIGDVFRIESESPDYPLQNPVTRVLKEGVVIGLANHTVLITRDGRRIPIDDSGAPIKDSEGNILGVVLVFADITERRKTENQLRESEQKFRAIFENIHEGIYQVTAEGQFLTVNPALVRILGYPDADTLAGVNLRKRIFRHDEDFIRLNQIAMLQQDVTPFETRWHRHNFSLIDVQINNRAVYDEQGQLAYFEGTVEDITARKILEQQLQQSQKLEVVGTIAGGIAHDFNNMLTVMKMNLQLAKMKVHQPESVIEALGQISAAVQRAETLTKKILSFSRQHDLHMEMSNLNHIVQSVLKMLEHVMPAHIELTVQTDPHLGNSKLDTVQIEQVLMNICINARDAMPSGGQLTIRTFNVTVDRLFTDTFPGAGQSSYVCVSVRDTGIGMTEEIKQRIFEPFFTTKESGKGTGLGLSTAYALVKGHGGFFNVDSHPGQGTTIDIYIPSVKEQIIKSEEAQSGPSYRGQECILIVEDQENIRKAAKKILESAGYQTIEAADGDEAVKIFEANTGRIDLIFIDQMLPKKNALEVHQSVNAIKPETVFLVTSGYRMDENQRSYMSGNGIDFLAKPYESDSLLKKIKHILSKRTGSVR